MAGISPLEAHTAVTLGQTLPVSDVACFCPGANYQSPYLARDGLLVVLEAVPAEQFVPALRRDEDVVQLVDEVLLDGQNISVYKREAETVV